MRVTGINSICFYTSNISRLRNFYIELLGTEPLIGDHERFGWATRSWSSCREPRSLISWDSGLR